MSRKRSMPGPIPFVCDSVASRSPGPPTGQELESFPTPEIWSQDAFHFLSWKPASAMWTGSADLLRIGGQLSQLRMTSTSQHTVDLVFDLRCVKESSPG